MSPTVPLAMFGFIPFVLFLFAKLPPHRAALVGFLLGWMFLPDYRYSFAGLPEYDKTMAASIAVLLGAIVFDRKSFAAFRPSLPDFLMLFWFLTPVFASVANGLGLYDGLSSLKNYVTTWGAPYLIGRLYFNRAEAIRDLLWGLFLGALIYSPLCWIEMRLSPQLHNLVYGYHAHEFQQSIRTIGYRPTVFMHHGLMVGMWMAGGSLAGLILWKWDNQVAEIRGISMKALVVFVLITTVACQSLGAVVLLLVGYLVLTFCKKWNSIKPALFLALFPFFFLIAKISHLIDGSTLVKMFRFLSDNRANSLAFRFVNENRLVEKALERPIFGWGGWGRSRIYDESGNDITVTDSYWIIIFGQTGIVGLLAFSLILLYPILQFLRRYTIPDWTKDGILHAVPLMMLLVLYFSDSLVNDMKTPVYMLIMGALALRITENTAVRPSSTPNQVKLPRVLV